MVCVCVGCVKGGGGGGGCVREEGRGCVWVGWGGRVRVRLEVGKERGVSISGSEI